MTDQQNESKDLHNLNTDDATQQRIAEQKKQAIELMGKHKGIVKYVCEALHISRSTFYNWRNSDTEFAQACVDAQEDALDHVENKLHELIDGKDTTAILFYMRCKGKGRGFVERTEVTPVDPNGNALMIPSITVEVMYPEGYQAPQGEDADHPRPEIKIVTEEGNTSTKT